MHDEEEVFLSNVECEVTRADGSRESVMGHLYMIGTMQQMRFRDGFRLHPGDRVTVPTAPKDV